MVDTQPSDNKETSKFSGVFPTDFPGNLQIGSGALFEPPRRRQEVAKPISSIRVFFLEDVDRIDFSSGYLQPLLTAFDALGANGDDGVLYVVIATCNDASVIPEPLRRPGRLDYHVHVGVLTSETAVALIQHIRPDFVDPTELVNRSIGATPAALARCLTLSADYATALRDFDVIEETVVSSL